MQSISHSAVVSDSKSDFKKMFIPARITATADSHIKRTDIIFNAYNIIYFKTVSTDSRNHKFFIAKIIRYVFSLKVRNSFQQRVCKPFCVFSVSDISFSLYSFSELYLKI